MQLDDGLFEVMILRKPQTLPQARRLVTCLMSQKPDGELLYLLQARRVRAVFDEPTGWTLDGEASPRCARRTSGWSPVGWSCWYKNTENAGKPVAFPLFLASNGASGPKCGQKGEKFTRIGVFFSRIVCAPGENSVK